MSVELLLTLPGSQSAAERWLHLAGQVIQGYHVQPLVVRHTVERGLAAPPEARRWSDIALVCLHDDGPHSLLMDAQGRLWQRQFQRRRWVRQGPLVNIYDEVFEIERLPRLQPTHMEQVMATLIGQQGLLFWKRWSELGLEQRQRLIGVAQPWEVLEKALNSCPELAAEALPLLLSEEAHPDNRSTLLQAGCAGSYAPPARTLPYLLVQVEWNLLPGLLGLVRASMAADPAGAWDWRGHPNPVVRRRLAELLGPGQSWLCWLALEGDENTRHALRRRLEAESTPEELVSLLVAEQDPGRRAALGWVLSNWSRAWQPSSLWASAEKTLGEAQRQAFRRRSRAR